MSDRQPFSSSASSPLVPFVGVACRDGRVVPFDADRISQDLFAATERLGRPDPFAARELTDGVLHFLPDEVDGPVPTTGQIAECVAKVVRELGQPLLARAFEEMKRAEVTSAPAESSAAVPAEPTSEPVRLLGPAVERVRDWAARGSPALTAWHVNREVLTAFSLSEVFARDLVAAHHDGLIRLGGLGDPFELAATVLGPPFAPLTDAVAEARILAGGQLVIDGAEHALPIWDRGAPGSAARALIHLAALAGVRFVVNLNASVPPPWSDELAGGPLFAEQGSPIEPTDRSARTDAVFNQVAAALPEHSPPPLRIDWHLGASDFDVARTDRLQSVVRRTLRGMPVSFVFDRPKRPISVAAGLDRKNSALLLDVRLDLHRLAEQVQGDPEKLLHRLGSLVRLALSAAVQKRAFLRRLPKPWPAFLLDRARLMVVPVGLDAAVRRLTGRSLGEAGVGLDLAQKIVHRLADAVRHDGAALQVQGCVDGPADFRAEPGEPLKSVQLQTVAGLTEWDACLAPEPHLGSVGLLHKTAGGGTAVLWLSPADASVGVTMLGYAWQQTDIHRLTLVARRT